MSTQGGMEKYKKVTFTTNEIGISLIRVPGFSMDSCELAYDKKYCQNISDNINRGMPLFTEFTKSSKKLAPKSPTPENNFDYIKLNIFILPKCASKINRDSDTILDIFKICLPKNKFSLLDKGCFENKSKFFECAKRNHKMSELTEKNFWFTSQECLSDQNKFLECKDKYKLDDTSGIYKYYANMFILDIFMSISKLKVNIFENTSEKIEIKTNLESYRYLIGAQEVKDALLFTKNNAATVLTEKTIFFSCRHTKIKEDEHPKNAFSDESPRFSLDNFENPDVMKLLEEKFHNLYETSENTNFTINTTSDYDTAEISSSLSAIVVIGYLSTFIIWNALVAA